MNHIRYKGYYYDEETGFYYLIFRYYDPIIGRFLSPDSYKYLNPELINGLNPYAYCNNDPVNKEDPTGKFAITLTTLLIGGLIGAGIGFGSAVYADYKEDGKLFNGDWTDYVGKTLGVLVGGFGLGVSTILGAGVGVAYLANTSATLFSTSGLALSFGNALAIGSGTAFITGAVGYTIRVGISKDEKYSFANMLIEGGINAANGAISVMGGALGGFAGLHNTVFTKLLSSQGDLLFRLLVENMFGSGFKILLAIFKTMLE